MQIPNRELLRKILRATLPGWRIHHIIPDIDYANITITDGALTIPFTLHDFNAVSIKEALLAAKQKIDNTDIGELRLVDLVNIDKYDETSRTKAIIEPALIHEMYNSYGKKHISKHKWDAAYRESSFYITCQTCKSTAYIIDKNGSVLQKNNAILQESCTDD